MKTKASEIKGAAKERDFRHAVEGVNGFSHWEKGNGSSHHIGVYDTPDGGKHRYPYAAHNGEVSIGVRASWVRFLTAIGLLVVIFACLITQIHVG